MANFHLLAENDNQEEFYMNEEVFTNRRTVGDFFDQYPQNFSEGFTNDDFLKQMPDGISDTPQLIIPPSPLNNEQPMDIQNLAAETMTSLAQLQVPTMQSLSLLWDVTMQEFLSLETDLKQYKFSFVKEFATMSARLKELIAAMDSFSGQLNFLLENTSLHPVELDARYALYRECQLRKCQLKLFERELSSVQAGNASKETELVILDQPFPSSIKAKKPMGDLSVRVLVGAMSDIDISKLKGTEVKIEILCDSSKVTCNNGSKKWSKQVISKLDETGSLILSNMQLTSSSSKIVNLRISVNNCNVSTEDFVVNSNGNQWACAEGVLLEDHLFERNKQISRTRFCNLLQRWYILATGQTFDANCKLLTKEDFDYFFETKFSPWKTSLTLAEFKNFWSWFGPIMSQIRFQFKFNKMWLDGAIAGFMKRSKAEEILLSESKGTFLIRVSSKDHVKGFTGIIFSFRDVDHEDTPLVKHYLVKENDILANHKSLADFAREQDPLVTLLSATTQNGVLLRSGKNIALAPYYNYAYEIPATPQGYVAFI